MDQLTEGKVKVCARCIRPWQNGDRFSSILRRKWPCNAVDLLSRDDPNLHCRLSSVSVWTKTHPSDLRPEIILFFVAQIVTVICFTISVSFLSSHVEDENGKLRRVYLWHNYFGRKASWDNSRILFICRTRSSCFTIVSPSHVWIKDHASDSFMPDEHDGGNRMPQLITCNNKTNEAHHTHRRWGPHVASIDYFVVK